MPVNIKYFIPAILWFIFITVLFVLPGSDFPDEDWFHKVYLDKWLHSGFFFVLVYLFAWPLLKQKAGLVQKWVSRVCLLAILYGIAIEFIQKYWIPGRSFDVIDMIFDSIGAVAAYFIALRVSRRYQKKISPCGNRGRNQN